MGSNSHEGLELAHAAIKEALKEERKTSASEGILAYVATAIAHLRQVEDLQCRILSRGQGVDSASALRDLREGMRDQGCLCLYSRCSVHGEGMGLLCRAYLALLEASR